jgi:hypothetical protein
MKDWVYWMGFGTGIGVVLFVFVGLPLIAYLGFTRKLKFLPRFEDLMKEFPNSLEDLQKRPPYNKMDFSSGLIVMYFELIVSHYLIKLIKFFKRGK